jgi:hypothetical protein
MHHGGAGDWLKPIEGVHDIALMVSVSVPSELGTCRRCEPCGVYRSFASKEEDPRSRLTIFIWTAPPSMCAFQTVYWASLANYGYRGALWPILSHMHAVRSGQTIPSGTQSVNDSLQDAR